MIKETLDLYLQDREKARTIKDKLMGKTITVNKNIKLDGPNGYEYKLTDFKFKINYIEGSNGKRIAGDNIYLVDKSKFKDGWKLIKWEFRDIVILDGKIQFMKSGHPKNLNSIRDKIYEPTFNPTLEKIIKKVITDVAGSELGIPEEDLTINLGNLYVNPEFISKNKSIIDAFVNTLKKYFIGKTFKFLSGQWFLPDQTLYKDIFYYKIVEIEPVHGELYNLRCALRKDGPFEGVELFANDSDAPKKIRELGMKYFNVKLELKTVKSDLHYKAKKSD